jgi:alpha/beta superfamily hydrolase
VIELTEAGWIETSDGVRLEMELLGGLAEGGANLGAAVVCHPHPQYGGDMRNPVVRAMARAAREEGFLTVLFNFRGTGASEGTHTGGLKEVEDVEAAVSFARELAAGGRVLLMGYSFGAAVATRWLNGGGAADAFVGVAVPSDTEYPEYKGVPSLYVNGEMDDVAPLDDGLARSMMVDGMHVVVEEADHFLQANLSEVEEAVRGFVSVTFHGSEGA